MRYQKLRPIPSPSYARPGDAAFDLYTAHETPITLQPGEKATFPSGLALEIPEGYFGLCVPRSSMAKRGLMLTNTVGIIDSGYRGEILQVIQNIGTESQTIEPLERLTQMLILPVMQVPLEEAESLTPTERGQGGFGSTGQ